MDKFCIQRKRFSRSDFAYSQLMVSANDDHSSLMTISTLMTRVMTPMQTQVANCWQCQPCRHLLLAHALATSRHTAPRPLLFTVHQNVSIIIAHYTSLHSGGFLPGLVREAIITQIKDLLWNHFIKWTPCPPFLKSLFFFVRPFLSEKRDDFKGCLKGVEGCFKGVWRVLQGVWRVFEKNE